jgi:gliding motility-associated protein GldE
VGFLILAILLILSVLLSGAETAYFSLTKNDTKQLKEGNSKVFARVRRLLETPDSLLNAILLLNTLVNVSFILLSFYLALPLVQYPLSVGGLIVLAAIIGIILLLFGEVIPKILAFHGSLAFACFVAVPLSVAMVVVKPISSLIGRMGAKVKRSGKHENSIDDLSDAINIVQSRSDEDKRLLKGIVGMVDTDVKEIMRPRVDVSAVDISLSFAELYEKVVDWNYSRIPVFENNMDSMKGVLYIKDLLPYLGVENSSFGWQNLIRPAYFVPERKLINDLLNEFQQKKIHMAIVVDEYGGTSGIVTLEDILEEIVGEIADETDIDEDVVVRMKDGSMVFDGKTTIGDFCRILGVDDEPLKNVDEDIETLAGLVLHLKGGFPTIGEEFQLDRFTFRVVDIDSRRVKKIKVILNTNED